MRLMEAMRLRIKDVDFDKHVIVVREAKGNKDRVVMLPKALALPLQQQMASARQVWLSDHAAGRAGVEVPHALETKYPKVGQSWGWFWVFPSPTLATDPRTGVIRRHHLYEERLQRGTDIRTVQELLGHSDVSTTMIYTHVLKVAAGGTASPLDTLH
jgi:site-specific recombinase XerD